MKFTQNKLAAAGIALGIALAFHLLVWALSLAMPADSLAERVLQVMGATFPGGLIQLATTALFTYGLILSFGESRRIDAEHAASEMQLLPQREQLVLDAEDVARIKLEAIELEKTHPSLLADLVKKACTQFRANHSVSEMMEVVQSQSRINRHLTDSHVDDLYHVNSVLPSIGFIGTIIGIASALGLAYLVVPDAAPASAMMSAVDMAGQRMGQAQQGIAAVTQQLYVAFDTTLWALVLNLVLSFRISGLRSSLDKLHGHIESYVLENLVNRIYHS